MNLRRFLFLLILSALGPPAFGQAKTSGSIPSTGGGAACVQIDVTGNISTVLIQVTGTWTGTLQPKISVQGQSPANIQVVPSTSTTAQNTITANGVYTAKVAGGSTFLLCGNTVASGTASIWLNASQAVAVIVPPSGAGTVTSVSGTTNQIAVATGSTTPVVSFSPTAQIASGNSLVPAAVSSQVAGSQMWMTEALPPAALTLSATGGSLLSAHTVSVRYTLVTALGETVPSGEATQATSGCTGGNQCSVTVTAPTAACGALPCGGFTGYTVYSRDQGSFVANQELKQTASNACVNITANCVIQVGGAGAAFSNVATAYVQPTNVQATVCPPGTVPSWFVQDQNGNYQTQAGVDYFADNTNGPPTPGGTFTFCRRTWFTDESAEPVIGKNAMVAMDHLWGNTSTVVNTNQDRTLHVYAQNSATDAATHYGVAVFQSEGLFQGTPTFSGAVDGEVSTGSFSLSDAHTNTTGSPALGITAVRALNTRNAAGQWTSCPDSDCLIGGLFISQNSNTSTFGSSWVAGIQAWATASIGGTAGVNYRSIHVRAPANVATSLFSIGVDIDDVGAQTSGGTWWNILSRSNNVGAGNGSVLLGGQVYLPKIRSTGGTITTIGSFNPYSVATSQPSWTNVNFTISNQGAAGATSYTYKIVAQDAAGGTGTTGAGVTTATGNATLDGTNFNRISISGSNLVEGASTYAVYRTASGGTPSSTGLIGTITALPNGIGTVGAALTFDDKGLAGDGSSVPTINTTGAVQGYKFKTLTTCSGVGTAASPSVVSCSAATAGSFSCDVAASAATCTVNTTAVTATSSITVTESAAEGTQLGVTCNTAPTVVPAFLLATKTAGTGFTINMPTITVNPACFTYTIVN